MKLFIAWRVGGGEMFEGYESVEGAADPRAKSVTVMPQGITVPRAWIVGLRALPDDAGDAGPPAI